MAEATIKGVLLTCPKCGMKEAPIKLFLNEMSEFECGDCNEVFAASEVQEFIQQWSKILAWIDTAPSA